MRSVDIEEFLGLIEADRSVFDVRTPAEFEKGHLLGAKNLPLFTDEERAVVGTLYKKEGRHRAILEGLDFVGPRMRQMVEAVERMAGPPGEEVLVHCWRGGMRSSSFAWLLELYGYRVTTLEGGYKAFRRWVIAELDEPPPLRVIGGPTGVGKTEILWALEQMGEPVIDLEGLANHRGSAFGGLLLSEQPTQQHFQNRLAMAYRAVKPRGEPVWIEDESRLIGSCHLPNALVDALGSAPIYFLEAPIEERLGRLVDVYGEAPPRLLRESFEKIKKRLGGLHTKEAKQAVDAGDLAEAARHALRYYDKAYDRALSKRDDGTVCRVEVQGDPATIARRLVEPGQISVSQEQQR
jgi:tRNA 2-selenouridine synthase